MTMWYVHPVNQVTNHEFARRLAESGEGSEASFRRKVRAEDGKCYDVIEVPFRLLKQMYDETVGRSGGVFVFIPFKAERSDEVLKFVPEFLLHKSRSSKVRAALKFVESKEKQVVASSDCKDEVDYSLIEGLKAHPRVTFMKY